MSKRSKRNGDRQAIGDRDDSAVGTGVDPWRVAWTDLYTGGSTVSTGTSPSVETPALPQRVGDVPILASKLATISHSSAGYRFYGIGNGSVLPYAAEAVAKCGAGASSLYSYAFSWAYSYSHTTPPEPPKPHAAPGEGCQCGFYGLMERPKLADRSNFLLDVEFSGRVVVHEEGYRAERQRVLAVHSWATCEFCAEPVGTFVVKRGHAPSGEDSDRSRVVPRCFGHVGPFDVAISTDALAAELRAPVIFGVRA